MFIAVKPCPRGPIGRFVSSYITRHTRAAMGPPGQRPHYCDRFQSCPILASVGPQTEPRHGVTLTRRRHRKCQKKIRMCLRFMNVNRLCLQWAILQPGRMELLSVIFIYKDRGAGFFLLTTRRFCDKMRQAQEKRERDRVLFVQSDKQYCRFSAQCGRQAAGRGGRCEVKGFCHHV